MSHHWGLSNSYYLVKMGCKQIKMAKSSSDRVTQLHERWNFEGLNSEKRALVKVYNVCHVVGITDRNTVILRGLINMISDLQKEVELKKKRKKSLRNWDNEKGTIVRRIHQGNKTTTSFGRKIYKDKVKLIKRDSIATEAETWGE